MLKIIIPVYKARATLPKTLDSLVAQTKSMFLVTLVQDCDNEDYSDIIEEYRRRGLKIEIMTLNENGGPGVARQAGMDNDQMCDYFMFVDSDDMLTPMAVDILYREAKKRKADVVTSDIFKEETHQGGLLMDWEHTPCTWTHGKIYSASYLRENNIRFPIDIRLNEDSYFNLVAINSTQNKFGIHHVTYIWRDNPNSLTRCESPTDFFKRSWKQYIKSQVYGLTDIGIICKEIDVQLIARTLLNIYYHCMTATYLKLDTNIQILSELKNNIAIQNAFIDKRKIK